MQNAKLMKLKSVCVQRIGNMGNKYRNIKSGDIYYTMGEVINCTNSVHEDDKIMVAYVDEGSGISPPYVRERKEFYEKFEEVVE